jgi:hypothetical protein
MQWNEYNLCISKDHENTLLLQLLLHIKCMFYMFNDVQQTEMKTAEPIVSEHMAVVV